MTGESTDAIGWGCSPGWPRLLCSGIAVSMVVMVGVACLVRRGWRAALFHTAPLGALYLTWYLAIGSTGYTGQRAGGGVDIARFAGTIADATFHGLSQVSRFGWVVVGAVLIGGLAVAWSGQSRARVPSDGVASARVPGEWRVLSGHHRDRTMGRLPGHSDAEPLRVRGRRLVRSRHRRRRGCADETMARHGAFRSRVCWRCPSSGTSAASRQTQPTVSRSRSAPIC